jgi:hypothetical protein
MVHELVCAHQNTQLQNWRIDRLSSFNTNPDFPLCRSPALVLYFLCTCTNITKQSCNSGLRPKWQDAGKISRSKAYFNPNFLSRK